MSSGSNDNGKSGVGEGVIQHKCPGCGAPLKYSPNAGTVICEYCGTKFEVSQLKTGDESKINFEWSRYKKSLSGEELEGTLTYECKQCGAVMEAPKNTIATFCPYCANNIVLKETSTGGLKPNLVIPFKFPKDKVHSYFKSFTRGKKLLPVNYFKGCMIGEVQGVYLPFWLFTTKVGGKYTFTSSSVEKSWSDSSYHYTKYIVYSHVREGTLDFAKVPMDASKKMKDELMDSIEPYDYSELVEFNNLYLDGFLAERFDSPPDSELYRAEYRISQSTEELFTGSATERKYDKVNAKSKNISFIDPKMEYALLPVYLFTCRYNDVDYHYAINGQTGKVAGVLPKSKRRGLLRCLVAFIIAFCLSAGSCVLPQLFW